MARSQRQVQPRRLYQLRVSLQYVTPEIWRRILVPERITLSDLHLTIGAAMGWKNQHLHAFHMNGETFGTVDESKKQLRGFHFLPGARFEYVYDFGDHWLHDIEVEAIVPRPSRYFFPRCTDGARQCPPEDCGGPPGYERILKLLRDPSASDPEGLRQWAAHATMSSRFDPDRFKVDDTNLWIRMVLRDRVYERRAETFGDD